MWRFGLFWSVIYQKLIHTQTYTHFSFKNSIAQLFCFHVIVSLYLFLLSFSLSLCIGNSDQIHSGNRHIISSYIEIHAIYTHRQAWEKRKCFVYCQLNIEMMMCLFHNHFPSVYAHICIRKQGCRNAVIVALNQFHGRKKMAKTTSTLIEIYPHDNMTFNSCWMCRHKYVRNSNQLNFGWHVSHSSLFQFNFI